MGTPHHKGRAARDRIKRMSLNGGMRNVDDMAVVAEYPLVARQCGFQEWQVRDAIQATKILTERRQGNGS